MRLISTGMTTFTILLLMLVVGCEHQAVNGDQQTNTVELKYGETKIVSLNGKSYSIQFTDVVEERCSDCTVCYKPSGIYADAILLINEVRKPLRIYSCTLAEEVTWEKIKQSNHVVAVSESINAGLAQLTPSDSSAKKETYVAKIIFMY